MCSELVNSYQAVSLIDAEAAALYANDKRTWFVATILVVQGADLSTVITASGIVIYQFYDMKVWEVAVYKDLG